MKTIIKYLFILSSLFAFVSCEIDDEVLERSDSTIYNKLEADRNSSEKTSKQADSNDAPEDSNETRVDSGISE